jgi:hypothetical protein
MKLALGADDDCARLIFPRRTAVDNMAPLRPLLRLELNEFKYELIALDEYKRFVLDGVAKHRSCQAAHVFLLISGGGHAIP